MVELQALEAPFGVEPALARHRQSGDACVLFKPSSTTRDPGHLLALSVPP